MPARPSAMSRCRTRSRSRSRPLSRSSRRTAERRYQLSDPVLAQLLSSVPAPLCCRATSCRAAAPAA
jgi:hypothetical protein